MREKINKFEIIYSSKKFSCNRVKVLKNATRKKCFKTVAEYMSKGYKIVDVRINGYDTETYMKIFSE